MTMRNVARILVLLGAALLVHAVQGADPASRIAWDADESACPEPDLAPPARDGAQLFAQHCALCHRPADLARRLQDAPDPEAAKAGMLAFLARHGRCDAAADAAIVDHLAGSRTPQQP